MRKPKKITAGLLIATTYFMVSGGPYGLEELVKSAGYAGAIIALTVTPVIWCLPTAFMVSELGAALPLEGGYYEWVKRALGPFWGFQEAWLSMSASVFEMAAYPTIFVMYLGKLWPACATGAGPFIAGGAMVAASALWNLRGARAVGRSSALLSVALLGPFAVMAGIAAFHPGVAVPPAAHGDAGATGMIGGMMIAMWNYLGWDNSSTIAGEVENPQKTYPLVMGATVALVAFTYVVPVAAAWHAGIDPSRWETGAWVDAARIIGGPALGTAVVVGGMICGLGMFHSLVMAYTRVPLVMAEEGFLPKAFTRVNGDGAPWVAILACSTCWAACLGIGFAKLVEIDVAIYGLSLLLEFAALIALRIKEPELVRPFRVWGGTTGAVLIGIGPAALVGLALYENASVRIGGVSALLIATAIIAAGPLLYVWSARNRRKA